MKLFDKTAIILLLTISLLNVQGEEIRSAGSFAEGGGDQTQSKSNTKVDTSGIQKSAGSSSAHGAGASVVNVGSEVGVEKDRNEIVGGSSVYGGSSGSESSSAKGASSTANEDGKIRSKARLTGRAEGVGTVAAASGGTAGSEAGETHAETTGGDKGGHAKTFTKTDSVVDAETGEETSNIHSKSQSIQKGVGCRKINGQRACAREHIKVTTDSEGNPVVKTLGPQNRVGATAGGSSDGGEEQEDSGSAPESGNKGRGRGRGRGGRGNKGGRGNGRGRGKG